MADDAGWRTRTWRLTTQTRTRWATGGRRRGHHLTGTAERSRPSVRPGSLLRLRRRIRRLGVPGWAPQPGLGTVQETLENALGRALRWTEASALTVAGRTDAGVHARGQVAHPTCPPRNGRQQRTQLCAGWPASCRQLSGAGHRTFPARVRRAVLCALAAVRLPGLRRSRSAIHWAVVSRSGTAISSTSRHERGGPGLPG